MNAVSIPEPWLANSGKRHHSWLDFAANAATVAVLAVAAVLAFFCTAFFVWQSAVNFAARLG